MNFVRSCSSCIKTSRNYTRPRLVPCATRSLSTAFTPSQPCKFLLSLKHLWSETDLVQPTFIVLKKQSKQSVDEFEEEFEEDFIDDVDLASTEPTTPSSTLAGSANESRHSDIVNRVHEITSQPRFRLASNLPSVSLLTTLLTHTTPSTLPLTLETIKEWRNKRLPLLEDRAVDLLVKRLSKTEGSELLESVKVLADRTSYGVELKGIKSLYPLFVRLSKPTPLFVSSSSSSTETSPSDPRDSLSTQSQLCHDLLSLSSHHTPSTTSTDSFAHVCTLATLLQSSRTPTSPKIDAIVQHLEGLGEDYIMQETLGLSKNLREVLRFRAMRVTDEMKKRQNNSVEWFAHLTEKLVAITP